MLKEITIEITQQCPNNCLYCSSMSNPVKRALLSYKQIVDAVDGAIELGAKSISLSGGEPFMHPDVIKIIEYIYSRGVQCHVYTSGIVLSDDGKACALSDELLNRLIGKVSKLIVNIEAADGATYDTIMGTNFGGFELMQESVSKTVAIGINVEAHVVPMKLNIQQLPKIIHLCSRLGISCVSFLRLVVQGRAVSNRHCIVLTNEETEFAKKLITEEGKDSSSNIRLGIPFSDCSKRINCMTGISKLDIRYDGKVYACEAFKNGFYWI